MKMSVEQEKYQQKCVSISILVMFIQQIREKGCRERHRENEMVRKERSAKHEQSIENQFLPS